MNAQEAVDWVDLARWQQVSIEERLQLLREVQHRISQYLDAFTAADAAMKGIDPTDPANIHQWATCTQATVMPMASNIAAVIELYQELLQGGLPQPLAIQPVDGYRWDIQVAPRTPVEIASYGTRKDYLRVKGKPKQTHPLHKEGGIVAVLGAGNYSSPFEMIRALFIDNCVVVHKPHHINVASDAVWEKVLQPLVDIHALAFCPVSGGRALTQDRRLKKIYFTGGTAAAKAIMDASPVELVSECGGNNPCLVVPGDRFWTLEEIEHQAVHIASWCKSNGGAVCGRPQTLITSRNWPQRRIFLDVLRKALQDDTPGMSTYYPGSAQTFAAFQAAYPTVRPIQPEAGAIANSDVLFLTDLAQGDFAITHEAFCQVIAEVPLDSAPNAASFLTAAVAFANEQLPGSLGACLLIDEDTLANHSQAVEQAISDLNYGGIAVNTMPPDVWRNPALTWGGNEEGRPFVSGRGNFGNLLSFENVEKSIVRDHFMSPGHLLLTNKRAFAELSVALVNLSINPTPENLLSVASATQRGMHYPKDF